MQADPSVALRPQDDSLLRDLAASPRPTGGAAIAAARDRCARELRQLGYEVHERPFTYSTFPGRFGTPMFGAVIAVLVGSAGALALAGERLAPAALLTAGAVVLAVVGRWLARHGVLSAPVLRARGVNLEATLPGDAPRVWLCAHLDSKSQPIPTLVRSGGIVVLAFGFMSAIATSWADALGAGAHEFFWAFSGIVTLVGAIPVGMSMVGSRSPGALDNASGVVAVVAATRLLERADGVGVLITDAEELGLAGARAWASEPRQCTVINCDGVDDDGDVAVMTRMFPGVLTDSVAFSDAGMKSVTVSRGTFVSFARVHSLRDDLKHLRGDGIAPTATVLAGMARSLADASNSREP